MPTLFQDGKDSLVKHDAGKPAMRKYHSIPFVVHVNDAETNTTLCHMLSCSGLSHGRFSSFLSTISCNRKDLRVNPLHDFADDDWKDRKERLPVSCPTEL